MRLVIQRTKEASVVVDGETIAHINHGLLILVGIGDDDGSEDIKWLCNKVCNMRIFDDVNGVMNRSIIECGGEIIAVSQFTLMASTKRGNRPSYIKAAKPDISVPLYEEYLSTLSTTLGKNIQSGRFGADMKVSLLNDGPVTIVIDSKSRE